MTFRQTFDFGKISKEIYQWFPGHMAKGLKKIYEKLPEVDAVIQVHDARVIKDLFNISQTLYNIKQLFKRYRSLDEIRHFVILLLEINHSCLY
jgi:hypothetical protein